MGARDYLDFKCRIFLTVVLFVEYLIIMEMRTAKTLFTKSSNKRLENIRDSWKPRTPATVPKRSSPRPIDRERNRKRANFTIPRGSVESLSSSTCSEENNFDEERFVEEDVFGSSSIGFPFEEIQFHLDINDNCVSLAVPPRDEQPSIRQFDFETKTVSKGEVASATTADENACEIYCHGPLLEAAQNANIFDDSKSFVDMKMKNNSEAILKEFEDLQNSTGGQPTDEEVTNFVNQNFDPPGSEFEKWQPDDWTESPKFLDLISDSDLKAWAQNLNDRWKNLGRKISEDVKTNSSLYSMIYSENPIVIPGGRFREFYYWDNYWIVRGLLLSEMYDTVKGSIRNFLSMVETYGFVPNGGRIYYTRRSQPPFLTLMVREYVNATGDTNFIAEALPTLQKEYDFWMQQRNIDINDTDGEQHTLNRYASDVNQPRPESYREDAELILDLTEAAGQELMTHITSACESGWDFSSRWTGACSGTTSANLLLDLRTRDIVPVDLNSILAAVELTLQEFYSKTDNTTMAEKFRESYRARTEAIEKILWNEEDGVYYDYLISQKTHNRKYFASNVNPLWTKCYPESVDVQERERKMYQYLKSNRVLQHPGGIPTSLNNSGQQWDFPNAWPPLVHMIIEGMANSPAVELSEESFKQAQKWISSNWNGYNSTSFMFEKYDVTRDDGLPGSGGEYDVQEGFGWTNGVVMSLLERFGGQLRADTPIDTPTGVPLRSTTSGSAAITAGSLILTTAVASLSSTVP